MNYATIKEIDSANGEGVRVSLFVSGCNHECKGCFNREAWNFNFGYKFTKETIKYLYFLLNKSYIKGLSLLGGEPFDPKNVNFVYEILLKLSEYADIKDKIDNETWAWSGYTYEDMLINDDQLRLLKRIKVLVDGKFDINLKDPSLKFRGSSNQRIINVQESLKKGEIIYYYND